MGSSVRMGRCERFIDEFNDDACRAFVLRGSHIKVQRLDMMEGWEQVYLFFAVQDADAPDGTTELILPTLFFDPEEPEEDMIERVMDLFGLDESMALERLKK